MNIREKSLRWFRIDGQDVQAINIVEANLIVYGGAFSTLSKGIVARNSCEPASRRRPTVSPYSSVRGKGDKYGG
jgi:hypothetical protein